MIAITPKIAIDEGLIQYRFVRSSGPGGQNVNKVATAVELRFEIQQAGLPQDVLDRAIKAAGKRMTDEGILVITARKYRTQDRNRKEALDRLITLIQKAAVPPVPRKKTKIPKSVKEKRLTDKKKKSEKKQLRGRVEYE